jgi:hypothetical protein
MVCRVMKRVLIELLLAAKRAEIIGPALVLTFSGSPLLAYVHSTNRIGSHKVYLLWAVRIGPECRNLTEATNVPRR